MPINLKAVISWLFFILLALPLKVLAAGSGVGTAFIVPSTATEGGIVSATITYVVPASSMTVGGRIEVDLPPNWGNALQTGCPSCNGYVSFTSTGAATFSTGISTSGIIVSLQSGTVSPFATLQFHFQNIFVNCPAPNQTQTAWIVKSAMSSTDTLAAISASPAQTITTGTFQFLNYTSFNYLQVAANHPSSALVLQAVDNCNQPVTVPSALTITLAGLKVLSGSNGVSYPTDPGAQFSTSPTFATSTTAVTIPPLGTYVTYYYETSSIGSNLAIQGTYFNSVYNSTQTAWRQLTAIANAPSFSRLSLDTGASVAGQTQVSFSPDGTGVNNFVYIRFLPSDSTLGWHVAISSNGFQTMAREMWGVGDPQSTIVWDGRLQTNGYTAGGAAIVPNGTYTVLVEIPGLVADTSMSIVVNTSQISGTVRVSNSLVAGAQINAQGVNSPGYSSTISDANGNYVLYGLHAATQYNLYATYTNPGNQSVVTGQFKNISAPSSSQNFNLTAPSVIRVSATAPTGAAAAVYGNLNVHSTDYSLNYSGNLRLSAGSTATDNGDFFNPSTWTVLYAAPGTYVIHLNMQGYGASDVTVTNSSDVVMMLQPKASIYGYIILPSTATYPFWASVSGTPSGSNSPTVWGGASFNVGQSSAIYSIFAVSSGTYNFLAQVNGFVPSVLSNVTVAATDLGNSTSGGEDFPVMGVGGTISGTLQINGDTSQLASPFTLYMNAYSPTLNFNVSTQVQLATSSSQTSIFYKIGGVANGTYQMYAPYLQGFDPQSFGPQTVVVRNGIASQDFTLIQQTGKIAGTVKLPQGNTDFSNVHISLQGSVSLDQDLTSSTIDLRHLGTGFYTLTAFYRTTGALKQSSINLTNNQTATVVMDLSAPTYAVTGTVSIQSAFSMKSSSGTQVTINTLPDLLANATNQNLYIGGTSSSNNGLTDCSQTVPLTTTTARVEAFPKTFNSFGNLNRNGLANCFALGGYNFGVIDSSGSYTIPNLTPGVWEIDVYPYFDNGQTPNSAVLKQTVTITNGNATGINFALSAGNSVSGTVSLPSGISDVRQFNIQIQNTRGDAIQNGFLELGIPGQPVPSVDYKFTNLPAGQYSLLIQDVPTFDTNTNQSVIKYVSAPVQFTINNADDTGVNVSLARAARIQGTLGIQTSSTTLTLITSNNLTLLPGGFQIFAQANPWIAGGSQSANPSMDGTNKPAIDASNHFTIDGLAAGTYDISFAQNSYGLSVQASGGINLASYTRGSVIVTAGQTLDLGTITLKPGIALSGTITDTANNPLSNITVRANPSATKNGNNSFQVTTDAQGNFTLAGLNADLKIYDIVAAPRPGTNDTTPPVPYGQVSRVAVDVTQVPAPSLNFTLTSATAQFSGQIVTADGGPLSYPDGEQVGFPAAAIYLHLEGSNTDDNPLGQEAATNLDGSFAIGDLVAGTYDISVESLGYQPYRVLGVSLGAGASKSLPKITLQRGAELDATLAKPDGSLVNNSQVDNAVAVTPDLANIIFAQINKDASTGNILSLVFSGFQVSPQVYNILLIDKQNNIISPPEGRNLVFTSSTAIVSRALTYAPSAPFSFTDVKRAGAIGSAVTITYYFSRPLRNQGGDQDPSQWFTLTNAQGSLSNYQLSGDRSQLAVFYTPAPGEQNATIAFSAHTVDIDPSTGVEFVLSKNITLLLGQRATTEANINPALGGSISLATSQDPSGVLIPGNTLLNSNGSAADATVAYNLTLTATDDINSVSAGLHAARTSAYNSLLSYGRGAYVSEAYQAMHVAHDDAGVNPLSSFYSILLPAGLSHSLNQTAFLTLNYDSTADPTQINVYYFDGAEYILQNGNRTIDQVNRTITVGVNHFSTFVVLQNNSPIITVNGGSGTGPDIDVFNFPNPFNLQTKTELLTHGGSQGSVSTDGTVIRYFVPASKVGPASIRIYDVVGEKVRTISLVTPTGDAYSYVTWDGRNDAGHKVASGVYIGVLDVGGSKKFWKMAVIK